VYEIQSLYYITKVIERVCGNHSFYDLRLTIDLRPFQRLEIEFFGFSKCSMVSAGDLGRSHCGFVILGKNRLPAGFLAPAEGGFKSGVEASPKIEEVRLEPASVAVCWLSTLDRFHHFQVLVGFKRGCLEGSGLDDGGVVKRRCRAFTVPSLIPMNTDFGGGDVGMVLASSADIELFASFAWVVSVDLWNICFNDRTVPGLIESMVGSRCRVVCTFGEDTKLLQELDADKLL
jgi:hypothetical protein